MASSTGGGGLYASVPGGGDYRYDAATNSYVLIPAAPQDAPKQQPPAPAPAPYYPAPTGHSQAAIDAAAQRNAAMGVGQPQPSTPAAAPTTAPSVAALGTATGAAGAGSPYSAPNSGAPAAAADADSAAAGGGDSLSAMYQMINGGQQEAPSPMEAAAPGGQSLGPRSYPSVQALFAQLRKVY